MLVGFRANVVAATFVGGLVFASSATAATISVNYQETSVFGTPNLSQAIRIAAPEHTGYVAAGPFRLTGGNGFGDFVAFCIDLAKNMGNGNTYETAGASAYGPSVDDAIDRLFTSAYAGVSTAIEGAAFQLALWEIITDTGSQYDLLSGNFVASSNYNVIQQAGSYLSGLTGAATGGYSLTFLNSGNSQNLVTVDLAPVPVPAAAGMLGLGIASFFGLRRRKRS